MPLPSVNVAFCNVPSLLPINNCPLLNPVDKFVIDEAFVDILLFKILLTSDISRNNSPEVYPDKSVIFESIVLNVKVERSVMSVDVFVSNVSIVLDKEV